MELDLLEGVDRELAEVGEADSRQVRVEVGAEWEERTLELAPAEIVSAPTAGQGLLIKQELLATI
jgi:hypothetical protein